MQRSAWGTVLQLIAVGIVMFLMANYWKTGKAFVRGCHMGMQAVELRNQAALLDTRAEASKVDCDEESATSTAATTFPYPADYQAYCALVREHSRRARPWQDRWGTDLWYKAYVYNGQPGYTLGSAGPDRTWLTKDDLYLGKCGEQCWTQNLTWSAGPSAADAAQTAR